MATRRYFIRNKLESWLVAAIVVMSLLQLAVLGFASQHLLASVIEEKTGQQALAIARSLASRPDIIHAVEAESVPEPLQRELALLQHGYGASYVVIGNESKIRLFHPVTDRVGQPMQGGDSQAALEGNYYISSSTGSMGPSIRGKAPVINASGDVIGLVSVGFLEKSVSLAIEEQTWLILGVIFVILALAVIAARWIGNRVRSRLFGLQPDEIGRLYAEQEAIFNTVRTGIIAMTLDGKIQRMNQRARVLLFAENEHGGTINDILPQHAEFLLKNTDKHIRGFELFANQQWLVLSRVPLQVQGQMAGLMLTMRPADEVEHLSQQLARVEAFAELLRVQTHDYSNKLNTLAALLQMGNVEKALELISNESQEVQTQVHSLVGRVQTPVLAALLFGKYHKAQEGNVALDISPDTQLSVINDKHLLECLVSIFGNLIDNAIEASQRASSHRPAKVSVSLEEMGNNIVFDVEDSGDGIPAAEYERIFAPSFSSKSDARHGVGMYLVKTHLEGCNGSIEIGESESGGARFSVYIPRTEVSK
ncbi:sensor histidine kinase [Alteromonas sp. 1_MG-2023]|uniref:sensor histidine kinase n=1 Tax=Alteromonas sp. 1_MG-2023 TaxID=3062669 RepID=UPI0026D851D8|nr:sensor histidine kinase [Alteromonas sp. 1_MG-2023]MDO6476716.1 sensor histidine kinase [Alteromonas sp. 1_MG-2023]